jgi:hypothetical protein
MKFHLLQTAALLLTLPAMSAAAVTRYVNVNNSSPAPPYNTWANASATIQDAVDAAVPGDQILVTNGVYQTGGRAIGGTTTNRVAVDKPLTVQSVNGATLTFIRGFQVPGTTNGDGAVRCVYLASGAALTGFTLTNGATQGSDGWGEGGGGVLCQSADAILSNCTLAANSARVYAGGASGGTLNNCTLTGNSAGYLGGGAAGSTLNNCIVTANSAFIGGGIYGGTLNYCTLTANQAANGGGAEGGTLNNCTLTGNSASGVGGGAAHASLNNCTVVANSAAPSGGGVFGGILNNCIVYYNNAPIDDNYRDSLLNYSCTTPLPTNGMGNLTNAPLFVDYPSGDLRLQSNSPCINAGSNVSVPVGPDLDGNPRTLGGTVDIGAYEFQLPRSLISFAWLQQYSLPTDGSADVTDPDGDGLNNWQEWRSGTNPTDALSALRLSSPASSRAGLMLSWPSVSGLNYVLERGTDLGTQAPFLPLATNVIGQPGTTTFMDTNALGTGAFFYRVAVQE